MWNLVSEAIIGSMLDYDMGETMKNTVTVFMVITIFTGVFGSVYSIQRT
jgi:hypothetical protein